MSSSSHRLHAAFHTATLKAWQSEVSVRATDLLYPVFVVEDDQAEQPIASLPGQSRWGVARLEAHLRPLVERGLRSVLLFGVLDGAGRKCETGAYSRDDASPVVRALRLLKERLPELTLVADVCLCGYTAHGHCGVLDGEGRIDNPRSIEAIAQTALAYARAGADVVAPSDMMDGRIGAIKRALSGDGLDGRVAVMSYAAKFASEYYGPFRDAAASGMRFGDRTGYQLPPASRGLAMRAVERDLAEGADMVMVKPGGPYLDVVRDVRNSCAVPVAVYQVSGEYAALWHGAKAGAFGLRGAVMEALQGMRRAGATILITYYAPEVLGWLREEQ